MPLSSAGVTLLLRYYGPIRHTASPVHSSRITSWCVLTPLTGLPVLPLLSSSMRATANTPTEVVSVLLSLTSQYANGLPLNLERVGFHAALFDTCSTFTHVPGRVFAKSPESTLLSRVLQTMLSPP